MPPCALRELRGVQDGAPPTRRMEMGTGTELPLACSLVSD